MLVRNFKWHLDLYKNKNALSVPGGSGPGGDGIVRSKGGGDRDTEPPLGSKNFFHFHAVFGKKLTK